MVLLRKGEPGFDMEDAGDAGIFLRFDTSSDQWLVHTITDAKHAGRRAPYSTRANPSAAILTAARRTKPAENMAPVSTILRTRIRSVVSLIGARYPNCIHLPSGCGFYCIRCATG